MFDHDEDKRSYHVTKVIFMAAENPSTTTIHTPVENFHETYLEIFFLHLSHSCCMFGDYYYELSEMAKRHFFIWEVTGLV